MGRDVENRNEISGGVVEVQDTVQPVVGARGAGEIQLVVAGFGNDRAISALDPLVGRRDVGDHRLKVPVDQLAQVELGDGRGPVRVVAEVVGQLDRLVETEVEFTVNLGVTVGKFTGSPSIDHRERRTVEGQLFRLDLGDAGCMAVGPGTRGIDRDVLKGERCVLNIVDEERTLFLGREIPAGALLGALIADEPIPLNTGDKGRNRECSIVSQNGKGRGGQEEKNL